MNDTTHLTDDLDAAARDAARVTAAATVKTGRCFKCGATARPGRDGRHAASSPAPSCYDAHPGPCGGDACLPNDEEARRCGPVEARPGIRAEELRAGMTVYRDRRTFRVRSDAHRVDGAPSYLIGVALEDTDGPHVGHKSTRAVAGAVYELLTV